MRSVFHRAQMLSQLLALAMKRFLLFLYLPLESLAGCLGKIQLRQRARVLLRCLRHLSLKLNHQPLQLDRLSLSQLLGVLRGIDTLAQCVCLYEKALACLPKLVLGSLQGRLIGRQCLAGLYPCVL